MLRKPGAGPKEVAMSRAGVGMVVEKLLTDENLRVCFTLDPKETLFELCVHGFDLTRDEVELFCRTDARVWSLRKTVSGVA
jgi:hypothetical protein